jgi:hypothetical protein
VIGLFVYTVVLGAGCVELFGAVGLSVMLLMLFEVLLLLIGLGLFTTVQQQCNNSVTIV